MEPAAVAEIQWFRTHYVVAEDRLRMTCSLKDGSTDVFWLTQRIANGLLKALIEWVNKTVPQDRSGEMVHRFAQQSARAQTPDKRSERLPEVQGWLVDSINVRALPQGIVLTFKGPDERAASVQFGPQHLRQWLNVIHQQYRRSGWPTELFPDWIGEPEAEAAATPPGLLH